MHERLHRVAVALALTEEVLADTLDELALMPGRDANLYRLQANRARITAEACRDVATRLDELNPDSNASSPPWDNPFPDDDCDRLR